MTSIIWKGFLLEQKTIKIIRNSTPAVAKSILITFPCDYPILEQKQNQWKSLCAKVKKHFKKWKCCTHTKGQRKLLYRHFLAYDTGTYSQRFTMITEQKSGRIFKKVRYNFTFLTISCHFLLSPQLVYPIMFNLTSLSNLVLYGNTAHWLHSPFWPGL